MIFDNCSAFKFSQIFKSKYIYIGSVCTYMVACSGPVSIGCQWIVLWEPGIEPCHAGCTGDLDQTRISRHAAAVSFL